MKKRKFLTADDLHLTETDKHQKSRSRKSRWKWRLAFYIVLFLVGMFVGMTATKRPTAPSEAQIEELQEQVATLEQMNEDWRVVFEECREKLAALQEQRSTPTGETSKPSSETEGAQAQRAATAPLPIQQPAEPPTSSPPITAQYEIFVEAHILDNSNVEAFITTNIPGEIEVVVDLALVADLVLASQAPDGADVWVIGTHSEHVSVRDGEGIVILDGSELPTGEYAVEVELYPRWGLKDDVSRSCGINQDFGYSIDATVTVILTGSGESVEDVRRRNEGRRWVMSNFRMGQKWDPAFWVKNFGEWKQLEVTGYNPAIIKAYYFTSIDMTLMVNILEGTIDTWCDGKWEHGP